MSDHSWAIPTFSQGAMLPPPQWIYQPIELPRDASTDPFAFPWSLFCTKIKVEDSTIVHPLDINNKGDVVGGYIGADGNSHAFRRSADDEWVDTFDVVVPGPPVLNTEAQGINDLGYLVG